MTFASSGEWFRCRGCFLAFHFRGAPAEWVPGSHRRSWRCPRSRSGGIFASWDFFRLVRICVLKPCGLVLEWRGVRMDYFQVIYEEDEEQGPF